MKVVILDPKIHRNLALFQHLIQKLAKKKREMMQMAKRTYQAYVNCKTGELQFSELTKTNKLSKEWKPILIQLSPNKENAFEVIEPTEEGVFDCKEFSKEGYALFSKTMQILNQLAYDPQRDFTPKKILNQLAHIDFVLSEQEEGRRNLVYEAWHNVNRKQAEHLLVGRPIGTYLFRKDEFATLLEDQLNEDLSSPVTCITLTYRDWEGKVSEKTLILSEGKWSFYNDGLVFSRPEFATVQELLATMGDMLSSPLLAD